MSRASQKNFLDLKTVQPMSCFISQKRKMRKQKNFLNWLITKWLYAVIFTVKKTGDCAYDFRHQHIQLRKKLNWCKVHSTINYKTSEFVNCSTELNKQKDNYSFKHTLFIFLRSFNFAILKIRWLNALSKKEDFEHTFSTNQPCHLQDGLEIKISVMFMTSLLFSEVFIMVEYFSKTE